MYGVKFDTNEEQRNNASTTHPQGQQQQQYQLSSSWGVGTVLFLLLLLRRRKRRKKFQVTHTVVDYQDQQANKQVVSKGGTTITTKQRYDVVWYPLEVSDDIDELQIAINVTGKDDVGIQTSALLVTL